MNQAQNDYAQYKAGYLAGAHDADEGNPRRYRRKSVWVRTGTHSHVYDVIVEVATDDPPEDSDREFAKGYVDGWSTLDVHVQG